MLIQCVWIIVVVVVVLIAVVVVFSMITSARVFFSSYLIAILSSLNVLGYHFFVLKKTSIRISEGSNS